MAIEAEQVFTIGHLTASADLSGSQYMFVKLSGAGTVTVCSAVTDKPIGVLQNKPVSGQPCTICVIGVSKVKAGVAVVANDLIGTGAAGKAAPYVVGTDTTKYIAGTALTAAGADLTVFTAMINCSNPVRGITGI
jgi:hypothetical protein